MNTLNLHKKIIVQNFVECTFYIDIHHVYSIRAYKLYVCSIDNIILFNDDTLLYVVSANETSTSPLYYSIAERLETQGCDSNLCPKVIFLGCQMPFWVLEVWFG